MDAFVEMNIMELYFKDLISEDASLEKLVDDLALVVQGADDFAKAVGMNLPEESRKEVATRLENLKRNFQRLKGQAMASARATDKVLRENTYPFVGIALIVGLLLGAKFRKK